MKIEKHALTWYFCNTVIQMQERQINILFYRKYDLQVILILEVNST